MRYLKAIVLVLFFFVSMIFFFQNQAVLSTEMTLNLNLYFTEPMQSIPLPFYFLVLAAFLLGAILAVISLVWDKMNLSARLMKANWRVRSLEKEVTVLRADQAKALPAAEEGGKKFNRGQNVAKPVSEPAPVSEAKIVDTKASVVNDVKAPDPDKGA